MNRSEICQQDAEPLEGRQTFVFSSGMRRRSANLTTGWQGLFQKIRLAVLVLFSTTFVSEEVLEWYFQAAFETEKTFLAAEIPLNQFFPATAAAVFIESGSPTT